MAPRGGTQSLVSSTDEATTAEALTPGDLVDGEYRVERLLGEGGGGAVYLVRHEGLDGARFALKILHGMPGRSDAALAREGRLAAEVVSAHVVKVAALGRLARGAPYLVMEYVEGPTLDALLADRDLVTRSAVDCVRQLCLALEAAHARGLVHGDVSLRNLFATPTPDGGLHVQLGDFGLARRVRRDAGVTRSVEQRVGRGTPRFASPEVLSGDEVDERSDVFSAGVVLYRLLAGCLPFDGASLREILGATLAGGAAPLSQHRRGVRAFEAVVARCLAPEPGARFPSARALREALDEALIAAPEQARRQPRPRPLRAVGSVFAVALVALASWAAVARWRERARVPIGPSLACPDADLGRDDRELAHALAQAVCARVGAALDVDWGGGPGATRVTTRLRREPDGAYLLDLGVAGRAVTSRGATPLAAVTAGVRSLLARADARPMSAAEIHLWGARDAATASMVRASWRRRTSLLLANYEYEPRAALARDPRLPLAHLLVSDVDRDPARRRDAVAQALANADRLPPARAEALRGLIAARTRTEPLDDALERLRHAYNASPDDVDIGVMYATVLVEAARRDVALGVIERLHERFPRRAALALHLAGQLPERSAGENARPLEWLIEAMPEARAASANICSLTERGRVAEADAALSLGRRLGLTAEALAVPEAVVALSLGDPARVERATAAHLGSTQTWSQVTGARLRVAGLLLRGRTADAGALLRAQIAARRAAGDSAEALLFAFRLLRVSRHDGAPDPDLTWMGPAIAQSTSSLPTAVAVRTEWVLARARGAGSSSQDVARAGLAQIDADIARAADADAIERAGLRLQTIPLARVALGEAEAVARWREGATAWFGPRVGSAYEAALALEGTGDARAAEAAYRLVAGTYEVYDHPFEAVAARVRLADLLDARGAGDEARALRASIDHTWSEADEGVRDRVRRSPR